MRITHGKNEKRPELVCEKLRLYRKQHAEEISRSMEGRLLRKQNMTKRNQSAEGRKLSSEVAKKTSSREDILQARTSRLKQWRNNNREDFYQKCTSKMHGCWHSLPEKKLGEILSTFSEYNFSANQTVKSPNFIQKSKRKQIDFADKDKRIYIEFDGIRHFKEIPGSDFSIIRTNDENLDNHVIKNGWTLIRISHDQFEYSRGGFFLEDCIRQLTSLLKQPSPGVHKIGIAYGDQCV